MDKDKKFLKKWYDVVYKTKRIIGREIERTLKTPKGLVITKRYEVRKEWIKRSPGFHGPHAIRHNIAELNY